MQHSPQLGLAATWYANQDKNKNGKAKSTGGEGSEEGARNCTDAVIEGSKAIETVATADRK